jgi:hypothetical protein
MSTEQAREAYAEHKEGLGGDLVWMKDEFQAMIEESKAEADASAPEEEEEVPSEV